MPPTSSLVFLWWSLFPVACCRCCPCLLCWVSLALGLSFSCLYSQCKPTLNIQKRLCVFVQGMSMGSLLVCGTWHWVSSDSWQPPGWWTTLWVFCPHSPAQLLLFLWGWPISYLVSLLSCSFYFPQHSCLLQRTPPPHEVPKVGQLQLCHWASRDVAGFMCPRSHTFPVV